MQNNKLFKFFFATAIGSIIFIIVRTLFLFNNYDTESGFFIHKTPVTLFYLALLLFCAVLYFTRKSYATKTNYKFKNNWLNITLNSVLAAAFLVALLIMINNKEELTALESVTRNISIFSAALSVIYYVTSSLTENKIVLILKTAPVLYFISLTISEFIIQTGHANTYNDFSSILALIAISFLVLEEGKAEAIGNSSLLFPSYFISLILISQSIIPDLISFNLQKITINYLILFIYFAVLLIKTFILTKNSCEDKK